MEGLKAEEVEEMEKAEEVDPPSPRIRRTMEASQRLVSLWLKVEEIEDPSTPRQARGRHSGTAFMDMQHTKIKGVQQVFIHR